MTEGTDGCREASFGLSVLVSFCAFGTVTILYILPRHRVMRRKDAIAALVVPPRIPLHWAQLPGSGSCLLLVATSFRDAGGIWRSRCRHPCADIGIGIVDSHILDDLDRLDIQHVGCCRPLVCGLPAPDRYWNRPWLAGHSVLHSDSRCAPAARYPRADILAAAAASPLERRANLCLGHLEPDLQSF